MAIHSAKVLIGHLEIRFLVKLKTVLTIPLFQANVLYNIGNFPKYHYDLSISRICITIQR